VLEAADGTNGVSFARDALDEALSRDFGLLRLMDEDSYLRGEPTWRNVFELYQTRARLEVQQLREAGQDVPKHLYAIRNSLAHGKREPRTGVRGDGFTESALALPIVKLLARVAVEPA